MSDLCGKDESVIASEAGGITILGMFLFVASCMMGAIAIDVANLMAVRTQLQVAADSAAHAALVHREFHSVDEARKKAIGVAEKTLPATVHGEVLTADDIHFGRYDFTAKRFEIDDDAFDAVLVKTDRLASQANPVSSILMQFVGISEWDVVRTSVFETYRPVCLREGFVADKVVDIQSNNSYFNGFCIHSNTHVEINQNNFFEAGTIVSMPDMDDLVVPNNGLDEEKNEGLEKALREGKYTIKILGRLEDILQGLEDPDSVYARAYIDDYISERIKKKTVDPADFIQGRIHERWGCGKFAFNAGIYENIVFISDCEITFKNGAEFRNALILTTDTSAKSMRAPNNLILGEPDDCASGGGAQLVTWGGVEVAASLEMHGSQILAAGNVEFAASADGIQGASIVAGGRIDGTSNMNFSFCATGMENNFEAEYFRMRG